MMLLAIFTTLAIATIVRGQSFSLETKVQQVFHAMDITNDNMLNKREVILYLYTLNPDSSSSAVPCEIFAGRWSARFADSKELATRICKEYFDSDDDDQLNLEDVTKLIAKMDNNPTDHQVTLAEAKEFLRKMYKDLETTNGSN